MIIILLLIYQWISLSSAITCITGIANRTSTESECDACERTEFLYTDGYMEISYRCVEPSDTIDTVCLFHYYCNDFDHCNRDPRNISKTVLDVRRRLRCSCRVPDAPVDDGHVIINGTMPETLANYCRAQECQIDKYDSIDSVGVCVNAIYYRNAQMDMTLSSADCSVSYRVDKRLRLQESTCTCANGNWCNNIANQHNDANTLKLNESWLFILLVLSSVLTVNVQV